MSLWNKVDEGWDCALILYWEWHSMSPVLLPIATGSSHPASWTGQVTLLTICYYSWYTVRNTEYLSHPQTRTVSHSRSVQQGKCAAQLQYIHFSCYEAHAFLWHIHYQLAYSENSWCVSSCLTLNKIMESHKFNSNWVSQNYLNPVVFPVLRNSREEQILRNDSLCHFPLLHCFSFSPWLRIISCFLKACK